MFTNIKENRSNSSKFKKAFSVMQEERKNVLNKINELEKVDIDLNSNKMRELYMQLDSIDHVLMDWGSLDKYNRALQIISDMDLEVNRVFDIGCGYAYQSILFNMEDIDYIGIDISIEDFYNKEKNRFITKEYPFKINTNKDDLALSILCLTWNCYFYEDDTITRQLKALKRDFNHVLLYTNKDAINMIKKHFRTVKIFDGFVYATNN